MDLVERTVNRAIQDAETARAIAASGSTCSRKRSNCITDLAAGWITPSDFCPACTRRFMAALDAAVDGLQWHPNFLKRSSDA